MTTQAKRWIPNELYGEPETCPKCGKQTESLEDDTLTYGERCVTCGWVSEWDIGEEDDE